MSFFARVLLVATLGCMATISPSAHADTASASAADPADKHLYAGQYDLATNLWGIRGAGAAWSATIATASSGSMDGAGYTWRGVGGDAASVKAYASVRVGASNRYNVAGSSGLPYLFGANDRHVDVLWDFTADGGDGGAIAGKYNHTLDVFFNAQNGTQQSAIRGEIMVITASSQDAHTAGWGARDAAPFVLDGETWDVWQATQVSNGYSWHVTQFRKRAGSTHFHHDLQDFFAAAAARRPDIFRTGYYVMLVEAGTEIKTGSGRVAFTRYQVSVH